MKTRIVCNTGPLIALSLTGCQPLSAFRPLTPDP
jgi:hypothetical protein